MKPTELDPIWEEAWKSKLILPDQWMESAESIRAQGLTIATLNGSFDLMHAGHLYILYEATKVADCLIVALNSDSSIQQYKSPDRPFIPLEYRLQMMAAIGWIDYVTWFDEIDPCVLLEKIRPDVHVNGVEYGNECIEAETVKKIGAQLHLVDRIPGLATTDILTKILQVHSIRQ
ncbi:MAG: adenylyltransferase/cytidyltransferase family protein [Parachlamydiales bacterium]|jgi:rfaE bifunctional protein nucleotidyltransferase chain/domain